MATVAPRSDFQRNLFGLDSTIIEANIEWKGCPATQMSIEDRTRIAKTCNQLTGNDLETSKIIRWHSGMCEGQQLSTFDGNVRQLLSDGPVFRKNESAIMSVLNEWIIA